MLTTCSPPKGPSSKCHHGVVRLRGMDWRGGREHAVHAGRPGDERPETGSSWAGVGQWGAGKSHTLRPRCSPEGGAKRSPPWTACTEHLVTHFVWEEVRRLKDVQSHRVPLAVFLLAL